jgi:hypothetical protein
MLIIKCPVDLKKKLDKFDEENKFYFDLNNSRLKNKIWKIIIDYYKANPYTKKCQWDDCNKDSIERSVNLRGEIVNSFCKTHLKLYNDHVKSFI